MNQEGIEERALKKENEELKSALRGCRMFLNAQAMALNMLQHDYEILGNKLDRLLDQCPK